MDLLTLGAAFLAGILTILSPCVLPILPIVFGSATNSHRYGAIALAMGLATGFTALGLFLATAGISLGLDAEKFRAVSALLLIGFGCLLLIPVAQARLQMLLAPLGNLASQATQGYKSNGLTGQFGLGLLLGAVWGPCVGPTLGAATLLASRGEALFQVTLTMLLFGVGVAIPLLILGTVGGEFLRRARGTLGETARLGKWLLGGGMVSAGLLVLTGADRIVETWMLQHGPSWATYWSTRF
jgi:cytochrome c-type biogenesis protein